MGGKGKKYRSPIKYDQTQHPRTVSPKRRDYSKRAQKAGDKYTQCTFVDIKTGHRCNRLLGMYPEFCELHTLLIHNVYIDKSRIKGGGNGLFAGPYGFKKGDIIGKYSYPWNKVKLGTIEKRCDETENCWSYVFCDEGDSKDTACWDGLDIRSTLMRNINDAHKSGYKNNSYFDVIKGEAYVLASKNIKPFSEILVSYGDDYW